MIAKIGSGKSTAGLIRYLYNTKKTKDHIDPHLVASWDGFAPDPGRAEDFDATKRRLVADLDMHVKQAERLGRAPEQHTWHCSVRAAETDRHLSDEEWGNIARRVVAATGIAPDGDPDGCRWVAVRHAPDHIHIAATKARADLRTARHWNDYLTADHELAAVEREYGLFQVVRGDRTAAKRPTRAEQEKAKRAGHDRTARERLRTMVRTAVAAATSTEEFISLLQHTDGILVDVKRFPSGDVRGYTVALRGDINGTQDRSGTQAPNSPRTCPSPRSESVSTPPTSSKARARPTRGTRPPPPRNASPTALSTVTTQPLKPTWLPSVKPSTSCLSSHPQAFSPNSERLQRRSSALPAPAFRPSTSTPALCAAPCGPSSASPPPRTAPYWRCSSTPRSSSSSPPSAGTSSVITTSRWLQRTRPWYICSPPTSRRRSRR